MIVTENLPEQQERDVIVLGGGVAGVAAAVSAARLGKRVLLMEKSTQLGGLATLGLINFFVPMCNGRGKQIIFGMAEELARLSLKYGYGDPPACFVNGRIPEKELERLAEAGQKPPRYMFSYSAEIFALALTEFCREAGVELMFDTAFSAPVMEEGTGRVLGVAIENKSGRQYFPAKFFVDATGDADLLARAGVPTRKRGNYHSYSPHGITLDTCRNAVKSGKIGDAVTTFSGGCASLYGENHPAGVPLYDGTDGNEVNRYLIDNQLELLEKLKKTDRNQREVIMLPGMCQFRTTRCIQGDAVLREEDAFRHFPDSVAAIGDFDRRDYLFEVPYGTLCRKEFPNVITAGRSAAAEGYAWDVLRVIPPAILTGQAAGTACVRAMEENVPIAQIDITALQRELERQNVLIHFDDTDVPDTVVDFHEGNDD